MMIIAHGVIHYNAYDEHAIIFEFGGKTFEASVIDNEDETFVNECFLLDKVQQPLEIDIVDYFGGFATNILRLLYDKIHKIDESSDVESE